MTNQSILDNESLTLTETYKTHADYVFGNGVRMFLTYEEAKEMAHRMGTNILSKEG